MPIVFCSAKLSKLTGVTTRLPSISIDNWNAQLFPLKGRKCIVFAHKETCYSFVLLDVLKSDLKDFRKVFIDNYLQQLENDHLLTNKLKTWIREDFQDFKLSTTDGDKSNIGFINSCIYRLSWPGYFEGPSFDPVKHYLENYYNEYPLGKKKYRTPKELMKERLMEYFQK